MLSSGPCCVLVIISVIISWDLFCPVALELIALGTIPETMVIVIFLEVTWIIVETTTDLSTIRLGISTLAVPMNSQTSDLNVQCLSSPMSLMNRE